MREDNRDREETILANQKLVWKVVQKHKARGAYLGFEPDDLFGYGCIGLINAYDNWNPEVSKFSVYAYANIDGQIKRALRDYPNVTRVHFTRPTKDCAAKITKEELEDGIAEEIAQRIDEPVKKVKEALIYISHSVQSTEKTIHQGEGEPIKVEDTVGKEDDLTQFETEDFKSSLDPRSQMVLEMVIEGYGQHEIGDAVGVAQSSVSRTKKEYRQKV